MSEVERLVRDPAGVASPPTDDRAGLEAADVVNARSLADLRAIMKRG